jgi:hypothetical protein
MASSSQNTFSPEMVRILKIFGFGSILFVFTLSFFNERRADNSGKDDSILSISVADRIYFKNLRASTYEMEGRKEAKMNIYRHGKRKISETEPHLNFAILLNRIKDEAYIYTEPFPDELPLKIKWKNLDNGEEGELEFLGGDKIAHYRFAEEFYPLLAENTYFEMWHEDSWHSILAENLERDAVRVTLVDFFRLINNPK